MILKVFIALLVLGFASNVQPQELKFEVLNTSSNPSLCKMKGIYTFNSRNDLIDLWKEAFNTDIVPQIDFNTDMVIAIFRGSCPTLSYSVSVEKIEEKEDIILVYVQYMNPGMNCRQSHAISSPYVIIKTKKTDKQIEFIEYEKIKDCKL